MERSLSSLRVLSSFQKLIRPPRYLKPSNNWNCQIWELQENMDSRPNLGTSPLILSYHSLLNQIHLKRSAMIKDQTSPRVPQWPQHQNSGWLLHPPLLFPFSLPPTHSDPRQSPLQSSRCSNLCRTWPANQRDGIKPNHFCGRKNEHHGQCRQQRRWQRENPRPSPTPLFFFLLDVALQARGGSDQGVRGEENKRTRLGNLGLLFMIL